MPNTYTYIGTGGIRFVGSARIKYRRRRPPRGRVGYESISGIEARRDGEGFVHIRRIVDREKDYYFEHVVDCRTGMVLRHIEVPLSQHKGSGTEKYLKQ